MRTESLQGFFVDADTLEVRFVGTAVEQVVAPEVHHRRISGVVDAYTVVPHPVDTCHIALVLDGTCPQQCRPRLMARGWPVGADQQQVVVELSCMSIVAVAQPYGETQVIADGGTDAPAAPFEADRLPTRRQLARLAAHAERVRFVVAAIRAVRSHPVQTVVYHARFVTHRPGGDKQRIVARRHTTGKVKCHAIRHIGHLRHIVAETGGESLRQDDDIHIGGQRRQLLLHRIVVGYRVLPEDGMLKQGKVHIHSSLTVAGLVPLFFGIGQ